MLHFTRHREMQIKTMRYTCTPIRMAKIRTPTIPNAGNDTKYQTETLICESGIKLVLSTFSSINLT
jgi:hypothetical protein